MSYEDNKPNSKKQNALHIPDELGGMNQNSGYGSAPQGHLNMGSYPGANSGEPNSIPPQGGPYSYSPGETGSAGARYSNNGYNNTSSASVNNRSAGINAKNAGNPGTGNESDKSKKLFITAIIILSVAIVLLVTAIVLVLGKKNKRKFETEGTTVGIDKTVEDVTESDSTEVKTDAKDNDNENGGSDRTEKKNFSIVRKDDLPKYLNGESWDVVACFMPFLPGYQDYDGGGNGLAEALSYEQLMHTIYIGLGFDAYDVSVSNDIQNNDGYYIYSMEKIEELSQIFYDGDISYQDILDYGARDEFKPRYDESTGYLYVHYIAAGPEGVEYDNAETDGDTLYIYYRWGGPGPCDDPWKATFEKDSESGIFRLTRTEHWDGTYAGDYIDGGNSNPDAGQNNDLNEWKQAYIDYLSSFSGDGTLTSPDTDVRISAPGIPDGIGGGIDLVYLDDNEIPEMILKDGWTTYIITYYNGKICENTVGSKYILYISDDNVVYEDVGGTGLYWDSYSRLHEGALKEFCSGVRDNTNVNSGHYYWKDAGDGFIEPNDNIQTSAYEISESEYKSRKADMESKYNLHKPERSLSVDEAISEIEGM